MMEYARGHGFPVPAVHELSERRGGSGDGTDRRDLHGRRRTAAAMDHPPTRSSVGRICTRGCTGSPLPTGPGMRRAERGDRLVHLDLHPLNVILSDKGPVVIDWPNAARGDGNTDVALTWVLISAGGIPAGRVRAAAMGWGRSLLVGAFLERIDLTMVDAGADRGRRVEGARSSHDRCRDTGDAGHGGAGRTDQGRGPITILAVPSWDDGAMGQARGQSC